MCFNQSYCKHVYKIYTYTHTHKEKKKKNQSCTIQPVFVNSVTLTNSLDNKPLFCDSISGSGVGQERVKGNNVLIGPGAAAQDTE